MKQIPLIAGASAKQKRLSSVALSAAVLAVVWAIVDEFTAGTMSPVIVSAVTSLVMLLAGFYDFKHSDDESFSGGEGGERGG